VRILNARVSRRFLFGREFPLVRRIERSLSCCARPPKSRSWRFRTQYQTSCLCLRMSCVACGYHVLSLALAMRLRLPKAQPRLSKLRISLGLAFHHVAYLKHGT
jgi:hypothetical protein